MYTKQALVFLRIIYFRKQTSFFGCCCCSNQTFMLQIFHINFPLHICKVIQMSCALVMQVKSYCNDDNINFYTKNIMDLDFLVGKLGWKITVELQFNVAAVI